MKVVHLLRKPCSEGTVAANVLRWGTREVKALGATGSKSGGASGPACIEVGAAPLERRARVSDHGDVGGASRYFKQFGG
jgi:hypothetical protein